MIEIYPSFDAEFARPREVTTPAQAEALPVGTTLTAGRLTAVKKARQYRGGRSGWWVTGFTAPELYPVVDKTLFRYARTWTVKHV